ncbi:MAG: hypothetical protein AABZ70_17085 [candidate division NC10 bacterium]
MHISPRTVRSLQARGHDVVRLSSSRIEFVDAILERVLPSIEQDVMAGAIVTVEDTRIRIRRLPVR